MKPTKHQQKKLEEMYKWADSNKPFFVLSGSAGTGKTFITRTFLSNYNKEVMLTATTHKAVGVLAEASGSEQCRTIHSALAIKPQFRQGKTFLKQDAVRARVNLRGNRIVVVDESSMIDRELMKFIKEDAANNNRKYLFIGDHCQIPPVNEEESPVFEFLDNEPLSEIIRQGEGSPIITLATQIRDIIETGKTEHPLQMEASSATGSIKSLSSEEFLKAIYETDFMLEGNDDKVIAWTNSSVKQYNSMVCDSYNVKEDFVEGLQVVFNEAYIVDDEIIANNGDEGVVTSCEYNIGKNGLPYYRIGISDHIGTFKVIPNEYHENYKTFFYNLKQEAIKNPKKWVDYYKSMEEYSDIRPRFASSVHKAQGSTFNNVFVDLVDIQKCRYDRTRQRLFYTAITRAKHNVYIRIPKNKNKMSF